jgi:hypothetical protein
MRKGFLLDSNKSLASGVKENRSDDVSIRQKEHLLPNLEKAKQMVEKGKFDEAIDMLSNYIEHYKDIELPNLIIALIYRATAYLAIAELGSLQYQYQSDVIKLLFQDCGWILKYHPLCLDAYHLRAEALKLGDNLATNQECYDADLRSINMLKNTYGTTYMCDLCHHFPVLAHKRKIRSISRSFFHWNSDIQYEGTGTDVEVYKSDGTLDCYGSISRYYSQDLVVIRTETGEEKVFGHELIVVIPDLTELFPCMQSVRVVTKGHILYNTDAMVVLVHRHDISILVLDGSMYVRESDLRRQFLWEISLLS